MIATDRKSKSRSVRRDLRRIRMRIGDGRGAGEVRPIFREHEAEATRDARKKHAAGRAHEALEAAPVHVRGARAQAQHHPEELRTLLNQADLPAER